MKKVLCNILCWVCILAILYISAYTVSIFAKNPNITNDQKVTTPGLAYKYEDKEVNLHLTPYDTETEELVKKYGLYTQETPTGDILLFLNKDMTKNEVMSIVLKDRIVIREGYKKVTDDEFEELVNKNRERFSLLKDLSSTDVKFILGRKDYARPVLKDNGMISENEMMIHNVVWVYWTK